MSEIDYSDYINSDQPFGPINASEVIEDQPVFNLIFEDRNEIYKGMLKRPSLIVGRRGAGKTSYLHSAALENEYDFVITVDTAETFQQIIQSVETMSSGVILAENIGRLWETLLWIGLFTELVSNHDIRAGGFNEVRNYLGALNTGGEIRSIESMLWGVTNTVAEHAADGYAKIMASILGRLGRTPFKRAQAIVKDWLRQENKRAVVVMDSLEEMTLDVEAVSYSLRGLLTCLGQFNKPKGSFDARFALPAELYHRFHDIAAAPLKNFSKAQTLHWHAKELVSMAARRLKLYLESHDRACYRRVSHLDVSEIKSAEALFRNVFPASVTNRKNQPEDSIAYILRHTQLLPRQFLMHLNAIARKSLLRFPIENSAIVNGIAEVEGMICQEIFAAFRLNYPNVRQVCDAVLPELPETFADGELHKVFNRHGKKAFGDNDYGAFKRMLIEIGAIGRVFAESARYVSATFEYTAPHKMPMSVQDTICVHPVFSSVYGSRQTDSRSVYPFGSDIYSDDYRRHC